jgi:outer membrane autotransporter protein
MESTYFGLYGRYDFEGFFLTGAASVAWGEADNERHVLGLTARSDTDLLSVFGQIGIGKDMEMGQPAGLTLTPMAILRYGYVSMDGFTESGAAPFDLIVDDYDRTILEAILGVTASMELADLTVGASVFWEQELTDSDVDFDAAFAVAPAATFGAEGVEPEDGCFVGSLNLDYSFTERVGMFVDYQAKLGSSMTAQTVTVGVRVALGGDE